MYTTSLTLFDFVVALSADIISLNYVRLSNADQLHNHLPPAKLERNKYSEFGGYLPIAHVTSYQH